MKCQHRECSVSISQQISTCNKCGFVKHIKVGNIGRCWFMDDWEDLK